MREPLRQHTVGPGFDVTELDWADLRTHQPFDREANGTEDAADDAVAPGMEHYLHDGLVTVRIDDRAVVELDPAVVELYAGAYETTAYCAAHMTFQRGDVGLLHLVFRMHDVLA